MMLCEDARLLTALVSAIDADVREADLDLDHALACFAQIEEANRSLADARRFLGDRLGDLMAKKRHTVMGAATFERNPRREGATKCMDEEGLWRQVLDTRIVDPETGEMTPQSEIIRMVYGSLSKETGKIRLTGASPTKLEAVGIDPEMFFEKADRVGWTLQVK